MAAFTKRDIVLFPFPYTDLTNRKLRPCLVLSDEMNEDIILCQITSKKIKSDKYSVELIKKESGLHIDSLIRCNMIFTASKFQIIKKAGSISQKKYRQVSDMINWIIKV